jgi:putative membrane protein
VLALALLAYAYGLYRRSRVSGRGRASIARACAFTAGVGVLGVALASPLDALGDRSLAAHMAQHMLLMALAPPLLLLGRPGTVLPAAMPAVLMRPFMHARLALVRLPGIASLTSPVASTILQGAVMWGWHLPAAMAAALHSEAVHYAMHASFLAAGLLFWHALMRTRQESTEAGGAITSMAALVATMMQMGLLGALLTFADTPRYAHYAQQVAAHGLDPLSDQQLAGLIMWVPSAVPYLVGGLALMAGWMRRAARPDDAAARAAAPLRQTAGGVRPGAPPHA